jgi:CSLREA domain-containing protein
MSVSGRSIRKLISALVALATWAGAFWLAVPAEAAAITVTTAGDELNNSAPCSLREAIRSANTDLAIGGCAAGSGADTITVPSGTYVLGIPNQPGITDENNGQSGDLDILADLTISGSTGAPTIIDGNRVALAGRVFDVSAAATVSFTRLTIRNGTDPPGSLAGGGGITNNGRATFTDTTITGNVAATGGGGVSNGSGVGATSVFIDSTISGNSAGGSGGGVRNGTGASSTFINTTIVGNTSQVGGGGVSNDGVTTFTNSTITGNVAGARGGGVFNGTPSSSSTFINSAITMNTSQVEGGGLFNGTGAGADLTNATVSGNRANESGGGLRGGTTTLSNVTITSNVADSDANGTGDGGGVADATLTVRNTIIAGNTDASLSPAAVVSDCGATVGSQGYNIIGRSDGCTIAPGPGDKIGSAAAPIDPGLGSLRNYGGPTATHALLVSSPARNGGSPAAPGGGGDACYTTDQRGVPRPQGSRCDTGAYEYAACLKAVVTRVGTPGNDSLGGTSGPDVFLSLEGKDRIKGLAGKDRACGGKGKDTLIGGSGSDRLSGDDAADRIFGGSGSDRLMGGRGNDLLVGGPGWDRCVGGPGRDRARSCEDQVGIP